MTQRSSARLATESSSLASETRGLRERERVSGCVRERKDEARARAREGEGLRPQVEVGLFTEVGYPREGTRKTVCCETERCLGEEPFGPQPIILK
jgi:hypothetical protein